MATRWPPTVSFATIPAAWIFDCAPSFGFRSTRYGAKAPGQTTSIIATSNDDECEENARASCEYDASEAVGCGTTFTLIPVCAENFFASARSRWFPPPTESPMNVIDWPPYFFLIAAAPGTAGAGYFEALNVDTALTDAGACVPADATLSETISAATASPAKTSSERCFTTSRPFFEHPHVRPRRRPCSSSGRPPCGPLR